MSHILGKLLKFILIICLVFYMATDIFAKKNKLKITIPSNFMDDVIKVGK